MGKILCDTTTVSPSTPPLLTWLDPSTTPSIDLPISNVTSTSWDDVTGLEDQQRKSLTKLHTKGVLWKHPTDKSLPPVVFKLTHGGDVDADGNCLFSAMSHCGVSNGGGGGKVVVNDAREMRRRTVRRFEEDWRSAEKEERESVGLVIRNMYTPDVKSGWGVHVVQEVKMLARKNQRVSLDDGILELVQIGMQRESAAESIYRERCIAVDDGPSWAKYMSISGSPDDEYDIITLQYTEEGLLSVEENRDGRAAAFGDDIAIECLATEFQREIYVVQAHGSDAMVDEDNCVFFLPHRPRGEIAGPPVFLFMKGTGWCGAGGDHYEPLIAHPSPIVTQEKVGFIL